VPVQKISYRAVVVRAHKRVFAFSEPAAGAVYHKVGFYILKPREANPELLAQFFGFVAGAVPDIHFKSLIFKLLDNDARHSARAENKRGAADFADIAETDFKVLGKSVSVGGKSEHFTVFDTHGVHAFGRLSVEKRYDVFLVRFGNVEAVVIAP